ncbi:hypothetical protein K474DRAFT_381190 [Panus rudis PR-1116 ss-1]|nr:hypothetical protein K474DRAFT_381190 [Panus rudis PR-1116 ss-1]
MVAIDFSSLPHLEFNTDSLWLWVSQNMDTLYLVTIGALFVGSFLDSIRGLARTSKNQPAQNRPSLKSLGVTLAACICSSVPGYITIYRMLQIYLRDASGDRQIWLDSSRVFDQLTGTFIHVGERLLRASEDLSTSMLLL